MIIIKIIQNLILCFLSYLNVFKCKFSNIKNSNYFILKNNSDLIDVRSKKFSGIKKRNIPKYINFVRSNSFSLSLKALLRLENIIIINCFHDLIFLRNKLLKKQVNSTDLFHIKIYKIIKLLKIKKHIMIDDYRLMSLFIPICNKLKIKSEGYMHGRISNYLDYQKNLKYYKFSKYYVWNKYFKKQILKINPNYKDHQIIIKNPLKNYRNNLNSKIKDNGILIIEEDGIETEIYKKIIFNLQLKNKYLLYFKFRPNNKIRFDLQKFLNNQKVTCLHQENIYKMFFDKKIKILIGFNSSLLIECVYYNIIPLMIESKHNKINDLIKDGLFNIIKIDHLKNDLSKILKDKNKLLKMKKKIWN